LLADRIDRGSGRIKKEGTAHENLLEILDNVIHQLDFTKKMLIIMVVSFFTVVPITAIVINSLAHGADLQFVIPVVYSLVFLVWLGVGIRQWIVFSRWTQKYRLYKEVQKKLDERLDFDKGSNNEEGQKEPQ
jgi:energy-coupling factor transporter transmembrane protein EcfT